MKVTYKKGKGDKMHVSIDGVYTFTVDETFFYSLFLFRRGEAYRKEPMISPARKERMPTRRNSLELRTYFLR